MPTPNSYSNIAEVGITSGNAWKSRYATYSVSFITVDDYLSVHEKMRTDLVEQRLLDAQRSEATVAFKAINKEIDGSLRYFKDYINHEYGKHNAVAMYGAYGIQFVNGLYILPKDNDSRYHALNMMVMSLSKENCPFKGNKYGLVFWTELRDKHHTAWDLNKKLDGLRSVLANRLQEMKQVAKDLQTRLRGHIKVTYAENYKSVWRDFGFQVEKYR